MFHHGSYLLNHKAKNMDAKLSFSISLSELCILSVSYSSRSVFIIIDVNHKRELNLEDK